MGSRIARILAVLVAVLIVTGLGVAVAVRASAVDEQAGAQAAAFNRSEPDTTLDPYAGDPVVTVVGDNMSAISQSVEPVREWPLVVSRALGVRIISLSTPGSGYTAKPISWTYGGTFVSRAPHVAADSDAVILFGGANDIGTRTSRVADAVAVSIREAREAAPRAKILVVGPVRASTNLSEDAAAVRNTIKRAAAAADVQFVDPISRKWVDGKKGVFRKDGLSLTKTGQDLVAARMQPLVAGLLK